MGRRFQFYENFSFIELKLEWKELEHEDGRYGSFSCH